MENGDPRVMELEGVPSRVPGRRGHEPDALFGHEVDDVGSATNIWAMLTPHGLSVRSRIGMLAPSSSLTQRSLVLGLLLALYPLGQFLGSSVIGALSDRFGRRPILMGSLVATTVFYLGIATALSIQSLPLLLVACFLAGLSESNIVLAQSAVADTADRADRNRLFGYVYLSASLAYVVGPLGGGQLADHALVS